MERQKFDMTQCKPGDMLVSVHGEKLMYIGIIDCNEPYNHRVEYVNRGEAQGTRTNEGWAFLNKPLPEDHDVIGFWK